jgi:hypothetical protein
MRNHQPAAAPHLPTVTSGGSDVPAIVGRFLTRLRRVPVGAWAGAARVLDEADREGGNLPGAPGSVSAARASLRRVAAAMPGVAAQTQRRVQNMVEIAQTCLQTADAASMRRAALGAALGLAALPTIGEETFTTLYAPFESLIPLEDIQDPQDDRAVSGWSGEAADMPQLTTTA